MKQEPSINRGTGVAASPFNVVKLELVLILIAGITFGLVLNHILDDDITQIIILACYGALASIWIFVRVRILMKSYRRQSEFQPHD